MYISIANDFTAYPIKEDSGKKFLEILIPKLLSAIEDEKLLEIDLTGLHGLPYFFVKEVFGKLKFVKDYLIFKCDDSSTRIQLILDVLEN